MEILSFLKSLGKLHGSLRLFLPLAAVLSLSYLSTLPMSTNTVAIMAAMVLCIFYSME